MSKETTTTLIMRSFLRLLNERPLEKITVKDIVRITGISRNTFYYHYHDIYALLADVFETEIAASLQDGASNNTWTEALRSVTRFAIANKQAFLHIYTSEGRIQLEEYIFRICDGIMDQMIRNQAVGLTVSNQDFIYIRSFYCEAIVGLLQRWIRHGMKIDPDPALVRLGFLYEASVRNVLERAAEGGLPS